MLIKAIMAFQCFRVQLLITKVNATLLVTAEKVASSFNRFSMEYCNSKPASKKLNDFKIPAPAQKPTCLFLTSKAG